MNNLLNPDNPVMQFITKIVTTVYLNILWFLCCLPIFTAGAATTALYYVTLKMVKNEEGNITKAFFHSFKENFKQGTIMVLTATFCTICDLKMPSGQSALQS